MIAALLLAAAAASAQPQACPATLTGQETAQAPQGWRAWSSRQGDSHPLRDVTFSDGDPAGLTFLSPSATPPPSVAAGLTSTRSRGRASA